jgi:hypothetical protein
LTLSGDRFCFGREVAALGGAAQVLADSMLGEVVVVTLQTTT